MKNRSALLPTAVCLLPMLLSAALYSRLPEQVAVHFSSAGAPDQFLPKAAAAFGLPLFLAAVNLYSCFRAERDPKSAQAPASLKLLLRWLIPLLSVVLVPVTLFLAMGAELPIFLIAQALAGVSVLICGNDLPKCRQNSTIGFKLPWTLDSEEIWNRTHRFAGFVWVIGGLCILLNAFLYRSGILLSGILILLAVLPLGYSWLLDQKRQRQTKRP